MGIESNALEVSYKLEHYVQKGNDKEIRNILEKGAELSLKTRYSYTFHVKDEKVLYMSCNIFELAVMSTYNSNGQGYPDRTIKSKEFSIYRIKIFYSFANVTGLLVGATSGKFRKTER